MMRAKKASKLSSKKKRADAKKVEVSIIIKALNEEENIQRAIESSIKAMKNLEGEIILADSLSTDKTVDIAKDYPVRIVQLTDPKDRSCGVGPQLGFQHSKGEYIYILDGDMELEKGFLEKAIDKMEKEPRLAGVAGTIEEMRATNIVFKRRKDQKKITKTEYVDRLEMGGLYRRKAIEEAGYFSNRNLHAYEEAELGFRLTSNGWSLCRITVPSIKHYGYNTTSFGTFKRRWKTRYVRGSGEFLKATFGKPYFFRTLWHLKIYVGVVAWWLTLFLSIALFANYVLYLLAITVLLLLLFLVKKKSISEWMFSLVSWHYSSAGLIWGLLSRQKDPKERIRSKVIV